MSLIAIAPGPGATIQDSGRFGFRQFGVPVSGPFDRASAAVANALVGNPVGTAVLELIGFGGIYKAEGALALAIAGAPMSVQIEGSLRNVRERIAPCSFGVRRGETLRIGATTGPEGFRSYLAVQGGWKTGEILGSRSSELPIRAGDRLGAQPSHGPFRTTKLGSLAPSDDPIRYLDGPDVSTIPESSLESRVFRVGANSNRLGVRLEGDSIPAVSPENRLSSPVSPGTIQLAGGLPIILGPACGTMGGYPHVGQVLSCDLDRIGQLRPGGTVRFQRIELEEAREIDAKYRAMIHLLWLQLSIGCA